MANYEGRTRTKTTTNKTRAKLVEENKALQVALYVLHRAL
jgi:hypothetical protein